MGRKGEMRAGKIRTGAMSQRQLRVGEVVRHALSHALDRGEANDPGLEGASITVTQVTVSPDLRNVTAYVMPLGGGNADEILESLRRAAPFFRRRMGAVAALKRLPALSFELDSSFDTATRIEELLREANVTPDIMAEAAPDDGP